eukprot:CAMPEP_0196570616 /NCGR_PEP_ID=MMETSP1081-20130531/752_1 /TAXON_ID=36882 /ORGANISM="Pyramimonas amylifera, Strain CCMP720" /LENGTH=192 /DNA_ID=CAMNT_0041887157 /DNA_START=112 /DNA_END=690 /DNA_ORIENTATION=+
MHMQPVKCATVSQRFGAVKSVIKIRNSQVKRSTDFVHFRTLSKEQLVTRATEGSGSKSVKVDGVDVELDLDLGADSAKEEQEFRPVEKFAVIDSGLWECKSCQYIFNESVGDPDFPVAAGTPFKSVPEDYQCPVCGAEKNLFSSKSKTIAGFAENQGYGLGTNGMTSGQKSILIYGGLFLFFGLFISGYLLD